MRWLAGLAVAVLCILSGLLGMTAGINLNPDSTVRFVPNWGSVGDWMAGLGAFAAVAVSLWLARRKDDVRINLAASSNYVTIRVVSHGIYPVTIKDILISAGTKGISVPLGLAEGAPTFPARLEPRDEIEIIWPVKGMIQWMLAIQHMGVNSLDQIRIEAWMPAGRCKVPLDKTIKALLEQVAQANDMLITNSKK